MSNGQVSSSALLLRDFVNTYEPQVDQERLTGPEALSDWLCEHGLLSAGVCLRPADLRTAVAFREGLREVLLGHGGHATDRAALRRLDDNLAAVPVRLTFADGGPRLRAAGNRPLDIALAGLVEAIRECAEDGAWIRLKVCHRDTCRWAYYDASRNQARRWCSMAGCGNYVKMRRAHAVRRNRRSATDGTDRDD
ncbi:CGNR zinc finger domain-containing protein [Micromonospora sp. NPDC051141]|uniref:CGNR zinc finger domain-containing protein n=1 Tax=Micromonospora sp. NPDC051141 TaxID=3364284 RepID=UPI0037A4A136